MFVLGIVLMAVGLTGCRYFKTLDGPGMERNPADYDSVDNADKQKVESADSVKEFAELIADSNVVILDVRKADEFAEGHIKGAVLIDQFQSDFLEQAQAKLPKDKIIAVYCRSGRRSANAADKLADVGYKCVNLKGGILAWKEANMPVTKEE